MPDRVPPKLEVKAVRFADEYVFVDVHVFWDDGEAALGAGNVIFQLPIPATAAQDLQAVRAAALEAVRQALDTETLRAWRGGPRQ